GLGVGTDAVAQLISAFVGIHKEKAACPFLALCAYHVLLGRCHTQSILKLRRSFRPLYSIRARQRGDTLLAGARPAGRGGRPWNALREAAGQPGPLLRLRAPMPDQRWPTGHLQGPLQPRWHPDGPARLRGSLAMRPDREEAVLSRLPGNGRAHVW